MEVLTKPWAKIQKKLERFLEDEDLSIEEQNAIQQNFKLVTADSFLSGLSEGLPDDELDRVAVIFSRLAHVFEYGLLITGAKSPFRPLAAFDFGAIRNLRSETKLTAQLGTIPFGSFVRPKSKLFLSQVQSFFPTLRPEDEIFLIRLTPQSVLAVGSQLARPWLLPHLEKVQAAISKALGT